MSAPRRTNAEWTELIQKLEALIADPTETRERKRKAQTALDVATRSVASAYHPEGAAHHRPRPSLAKGPSQTDYDENYDGVIV